MRRSRQWEKREQSRLPGYGIALILGLALGAVPNVWVQLVAIPLALYGAVGMYRWGLHRMRVWQAERAAQIAKERRQAVRAARRERQEQRRQEKEAQKEREARLAAQREEERTAQREEEQRRSAEAATLRAAREEGIVAEVARLRRLTSAELLAEVTDTLTQRGYMRENDAGEAEIVHFLTHVPSRVALYLPPEVVAEARDVQTLEAWRERVGAEEASLIAVGGFTPEAVRLVRDLPAIRLIEAHQLAHWTTAYANARLAS